MPLPQEEVLLWRGVHWDNFKYGGSMQYTEQVQEKQPVICSGESNDELSLGLKEIQSESEGVYQDTRIQTSTIILVNYSALAKDIEVNEAHAAIIES